MPRTEPEEEEGQLPGPRTPSPPFPAALSLPGRLSSGTQESQFPPPWEGLDRQGRENKNTKSLISRK